MSLINDMLRDLEQRHAAATPFPNEVRPLPTAEPDTPRYAWLLALAAVTAGAAGAYWYLVPDAWPVALTPATVAPARAPAAAVPPAPSSSVSPPASLPGTTPAAPVVALTTGAAALPVPASEPSAVPAATPPAATPPGVASPTAPAASVSVPANISTAIPPAVAPSVPVAAPPAVPALPKATPAVAPQAGESAKSRPAGDKMLAKAASAPAPRADLRLATGLSMLDRIDAAPLPKTSAVAAPSPAPGAATKAGTAESDALAYAEADLRRARDLLAQGARAEAETLFRQGLAKLPGQTAAAMTLARLQIERNDAVAAWDTLQASLPHAREQAAYRAFCGTVLQRLNRSGEAAEHYRAALRQTPGEGRWWIGLGLALEGAGKMAEARDAFARARASGNLAPEMAAFADQKIREQPPR